MHILLIAAKPDWLVPCGQCGWVSVPGGRMPAAPGPLDPLPTLGPVLIGLLAILVHVLAV